MKSIPAPSNRAWRSCVLAVAALATTLAISTPTVAQSIQLSWGELLVDNGGHGTLAVEMRSFRPISGFEFELSGFEIIGASGGATSAWDFDVHGDGIVAHDAAGGWVNPGFHTLTVLEIQLAERQQETCMLTPVFSDPAGSHLAVAPFECLNLGVTLEFGEVVQTAPTQGTIEVLVTNPVYPIEGFQFEFDGVTILGVTGGETVGGGWSVSANPDGVIGAHLSGGSLSTGEHLLTIVRFEVDETVGTVCLEDPRFSDDNGFHQLVHNLACRNLGVTVTADDVNIIDNTVDLEIDSPFFTVAGFQLGVSGVEIASTQGGQTHDWALSTGQHTLVGVSLSGDTVASGEFTLTELGYVVGATELCFEEALFSNPDGNPIFTETGPCVRLVQESLPPAEFSCSSDAPYNGPTVSGFLPGVFPLERVQLCPIEAQDGTAISAVRITLVSDELPADEIEIVNSTFAEPRAVVLPRCGDGLSRDVSWPGGRDACHDLSGDIDVQKATPSGPYVLHYEVTVVHDTISDTTHFDVPWVRIDLPIALERILAAMDIYLDEVRGFLPVAEHLTVDHAREQGGRSQVLYEHTVAAFEQGVINTVYAAISDVHDSVLAVRDGFNDSEGLFFHPDQGDEIGQLLHELYRASALESEDQLLTRTRSLNSNVRERLARANASMDEVRTQASANPVIDISWAVTRQIVVSESLTTAIERSIGFDELSDRYWGRDAIRLARSEAEALEAAIAASGGVMLGGDENAAVLEMLVELDDLMHLFARERATNLELAQAIFNVFDIQSEIQAARNAHLGVGDQQYWVLLAAYITVEHLLPNAMLNVCGHSSHPWYEENAFRWDYLQQQFLRYQENYNEIYLSRFTRAALGSGGDWKLLRDIPPVVLDPREDLGVADTFCGITYFYNTAYVDYDNCFFEAEPLDVSGCPDLRVDWYLECGNRSSDHAACLL